MLHLYWKWLSSFLKHGRAHETMEWITFDLSKDTSKKNNGNIRTCTGEYLLKKSKTACLSLWAFLNCLACSTRITVDEKSYLNHKLTLLKAMQKNVINPKLSFQCTRRLRCVCVCVWENWISYPTFVIVGHCLMAPVWFISCWCNFSLLVGADKP